MPELPKRFRFNLPDAFACYRKILSDFFERVFRSILEAEAHLDDALFSRR